MNRTDRPFHNHHQRRTLPGICQQVLHLQSGLAYVLVVHHLLQDRLLQGQAWCRAVEHGQGAHRPLRALLLVPSVHGGALWLVVHHLPVLAPALRVCHLWPDAVLVLLLPVLALVRVLWMGGVLERDLHLHLRRLLPDEQFGQICAGLVCLLLHLLCYGPGEKIVPVVLLPQKSRP